VPDILVYGSHHVSGSAIQVVQPFTLYLAPLGQLGPANGEPLMEYSHPDLELVFDLKLVKAKDGLELRLDFAELRSILGVPVPDDLQQTVEDVLAAGLAPTPLDLSPLEDLLGSFVVSQAALNAGSDLSFMAMRVEIHSMTPDGTTAWAEFYKGDIENHLHMSWSDPIPVTFDANGKPLKKETSDQHAVVHGVGGSWSLFLDEALLRPTMQKKLTKGLAGSSKFELDAAQGIDSYWDCAGHLPRLIISFSGDAIDVGLFDQDVAVDVTVTALLGIAGPTSIQIGVSVAYDADDLDEFLVELMNAIPVAFLGAVIGGAAGAIGGVVGAIVGYAIGVIAGAVVVSVYEPSLPGQPDCKKVSDTKYLCTQKLDLPSNPIFGKLALKHVVGRCDGPLFFGDLPDVKELPEVALTSVDVIGFSYGYRDVCGSPTLAVGAEILLHGAGGRPLHLCNWELVTGSDPLQQFDGAIHVTEYAAAQAISVVIEVTVAADALLPGYLAAPYPLELLLQTNGGARQITIDGIAALSASDQQQLEFGLVAAKADCYKLADAFWGATGRFNPKWSVDPGPEGDTGAARWWQVSATGLGDTHALRLEVGGQTLAESVAGPRGITHVGVVLTPSSPQDLSVIRAPINSAPIPMAYAGGAAPRLARRMRVRQTLLHPAARLRFNSRCREARPGWVGGVPLLFCVTEGARHYLYDISNPQLPVLRRRLDKSGVRGVVAWQDGFLLWGEDGLTPITRDLSCAPAHSVAYRNLPRGPVRSVALIGGALQVVSEDGHVHVLDEPGDRGAGAELGILRSRPLASAPWFASVRRLGRTLARVDSDRVELWTIGRSARLE
jgi:hypothetical protein